MRVASGVGIRRKTSSGGAYAKAPTSGILVPKSGHIFVTVTVVFDTPGSNFWQAPTGIRNNSVTAKAWGGGGGGGASDSFFPGGGGSGAGFAQGVVPVTPLSNYSAVVGDGGTAGLSGDNDGSTGGDSFFDGDNPGSVYATFGYGGQAGAHGGTGGPVNDSPSGTIVQNGGIGADGVGGTGGGGGGGAGATGNGSSGSGELGGAGGPGNSGVDGGVGGQASNADPINGGGYYGGGGAGAGNNGNGDGSNGGIGGVTLTYQI